MTGKYVASSPRWYLLIEEMDEMRNQIGTKCIELKMWYWKGWIEKKIVKRQWYARLSHLQFQDFPIPGVKRHTEKCPKIWLRNFYENQTQWIVIPMLETPQC